MNAREMNEALIQNFPEIEKTFQKYINKEDGIDTGAFLTYEDVFRKNVEEAIEEKNETFLDRAGNFIEKLLISDDEYAKNVIIVGVLEGLKANCNEEDVASFLKPKSLAEFNSLQY